jgi:hypothetical protein
MHEPDGDRGRQVVRARHDSSIRLEGAIRQNVRRVLYFAGPFVLIVLSPVGLRPPRPTSIW